MNNNKLYQLLKTDEGFKLDFKLKLNLAVGALIKIVGFSFFIGIKIAFPKKLPPSNENINVNIKILIVEAASIKFSPPITKIISFAIKIVPTTQGIPKLILKDNIFFNSLLALSKSPFSK